MYIDTSELCDIYLDQVDVVEPIFSSFGGLSSFHGKVTTVKCFENNGLIAEILEETAKVGCYWWMAAVRCAVR